jgi:hypothetical protein
MLQPQNWNKYSYVLNNPLALTDPDGREGGLHYEGATVRPPDIFGQDSLAVMIYNKAKYGRFIGNTKARNEVKEILKGAIAAGLNSPIKPEDVDKLDIATVFQILDIADEVRNSETQTSTIGSGGSPGIEGDPYHPDTVRDRVRPPYRANPAHDRRSPHYNPRKTPEPADAAGVYQNSVRAGMGTWYGVNRQGQVYQFFSDNAGGVHFAGIVPRSKVPKEVLKQLGLL